MVHSIELLFDEATEATLRDMWEALAAADIPSQAPAGRPHVTLAVADRIAEDVDALLRPLTARLPLPCAVGAPLLLGRNSAILTRLIVPTAALLDLHAHVHRISLDHLLPAPAPNSLPGHWTPHVTLARRVAGPALSRALHITGRPPEIPGSFAALRRWDGDKKVDYLI
ncbi:2'-5' RNA ligase family protein [Mycobacterium sp. Marseille-P9652]|uniref:2'-5' RNA ligase family protein n=1 Tax=Mycobacterium sp. Marseille-P9652 TaxID=2654950 RepID=UPI0012E71416|nr:2'-5' RNA ligase family protein [Mycobacterium sp. Marseille-P9652]